MTDQRQNPQQGAGQGAPRPKPGAMTMAMQAVQVAPSSGPKVLRIGVIQGGKIVEERIIRKRETVSVGTSERNHFVVQSQGMPARFELFQLVGNDYILNFTEEMKGRVGLPAGVQELQQLRSTGAARNAGAYWQVKLNDTSRGKVVIGDVTLLFQFVVPPPIQPRPQLPAAARGGFVKGIDWVFTAFVMFSFMVHFGFVIYLDNADWPIEAGIAEIPDELQQYIFEEPEPPPVEETPTETPTEADTPAPEPEKTVERPRQQEAQATPSSQPSEPRDIERQNQEVQRIQESVANQLEHMMLTGAGAEADSTFANLLRNGSPTEGAEALFQQANGTTVATNGSAGVLRGREGGNFSNAGAGGLGQVGVAGGGQATRQAGEGDAVTEVVRVVRGRASVDDFDEGNSTGDCDGNRIAQVVRSRVSAITACHTTALRRNPNLSGKITVQFTVQESGTVSGARAIEDTVGDPAMTACVTGAISRLRFASMCTDGSGQFSFPFVFTPQN